MSRFCEVLTQFSEYVKATNGKRMLQLGDHYLQPNLTPERYYDLMLPLVRGNVEQSRGMLKSHDRVSVPIQIETMGTTWLSMNMEAKWYALGAPEFKIHPGMVEALAHTKLEIPGRAVNFPFPCFAIRLPYQHLRESEGKPWVQSLLVSEIYEQQLGALRRKFCLLAVFEPPDGTEDVFEYSIMSKFELDMSGNDSVNVADCVERMPLGGTDGGYWPNREMTTELVALAISTALIAIGNDRTLVKQGAISSVDRLKRDRIIKRHGPSAAGSDRPFEVGADIKLPRRERNYGSSDKSGSEPTGRELRFSHIQSGHIRMARCKDDEGNMIWKPVFIRPCIHRPDLPMRPKTTPRAVMMPEPSPSPQD
jgi:hypothetical protein